MMAVAVPFLGRRSFPTVWPEISIAASAPLRPDALLYAVEPARPLAAGLTATALALLDPEIIAAWRVEGASERRVL